MDLIPSSGFPVGYVNMIRCFIDADGNFTAELRRYYSEEYRRQNPDSHPALVGVGGPLPEAVKDQVFSLIYPYVEAEYNTQALRQEMHTAMETADTEEAKTAIKNEYLLKISEIYSTIGIKER
jgi:hypothetical protein